MSDGAWNRMNCHDTTMVEQEVMGHIVRLQQNPASEHLGTTVWDASIVLAKYLEKNMRKGEFSRPKLKGKRVLELGAGMGLGGIAFSMLGADVVLTDTVDVVPLLRRNCEANLGRGVARVEELDWYQPEQAAQLKPPFDYVAAADCIYHENIVKDFHRVVMDVTNDKSVVLVVNELRSHSVHAAFMAAFTPTHSIKTVPHSKMDDVYQHPNIQIFYMKRLKAKRGEEAGEEAGEDDGKQACASPGAGAAQAAAAGGEPDGVQEAAASTATAAAAGGPDGVQEAAASTPTAVDPKVEQAGEGDQADGGQSVGIGALSLS
ncbi:hypothetical protein FOA52_004905 [Chlamydomonas sp. UWO 241]|nr:hypothetical protein FOA52_004905 [Chlamydomonas sp. UWO 241]